MRLINISKSYGGRKVLDNLNMEIEEGAMTCIMAPSGAGKTTLLRILMGLERADSGSVEGIEGRRFGAVFQEERLCENLGAVENIRLAAPRTGQREVVRELERLGLDGIIAQPVSSLSGGQRRRVSILRALMAECDVLCLDEPFTGLDDMLKKDVMEYLKERAAGKTVILVTHDRGEAQALGCRIFEL